MVGGGSQALLPLSLALIVRRGISRRLCPCPTRGARTHPPALPSLEPTLPRRTRTDSARSSRAKRARSRPDITAAPAGAEALSPADPFVRQRRSPAQPPRPRRAAASSPTPPARPRPSTPPRRLQLEGPRATLRPRESCGCVTEEVSLVGHRGACPARARLRDDRNLLRRLRGQWLREVQPDPADLRALSNLLTRVVAGGAPHEVAGPGGLHSCELWLAQARAGELAASSALRNLGCLAAAHLQQSVTRDAALRRVAGALRDEDRAELTRCPWGIALLRSCPHPPQGCAASVWQALLARS